MTGAGVSCPDAAYLARSSTELSITVAFGVRPHLAEIRASPALLKKLAEKTRVALAAYMREAADDLLAKYADALQGQAEIA